MPGQSGDGAGVQANAAPVETPDIASSSDEYAKRFAGPVGEWFLRVQADAILGMLAPFGKAAVLDVGGGHGQYTGALIERGHRVTVLGSTQETVRRVARWVDAGECSFQTGNMLALPFRDRSFDVVMSFRQLPHLQNWRDFLAELARVASTAVIVDFAPLRSWNCLYGLLFGLKTALEHRSTRPFTVHREAAVVGEFRKHGFSPAARFGQFCLPMGIHRALGSRRLSEAAEQACRVLGLSSLVGSPVILKLERD